MSDPLDSKKTKERSPAFPFIPLQRALERARAFYVEEKRGAAPLARAVLHWQYSLGSSGALQTIAALKQYGLLEDVGGSGSNRQFKLSDLALRILLDQREDSTERDALLRTAALNPPVAAEVFSRWPDGLPSDGTLHHYLVIEKKFAELTAAAAIRILKENQALVSVSGGRVQSSAPEVDDEMTLDSPISKVYKDRQEQPQKRFLAVAPSIALSSFQRVLAHGGVSITVQFSEEPTREVFEYLARYATFEASNVPTSEELKAREQLNSE